MPFTRVENASVLLKQQGRYRECPVYEREGLVYAKHGTAFVRLYSDGTTSVPKLHVEELVAPEPMMATRLGVVAVYGGGDQALDERHRINFRRIECS